MANSNNLVKLTGLWKQKSKKDGSQYLSGNLTPTAKMIVLPNSKKKTDKEPDYIAFVAAHVAQTRQKQEEVDEL
jgi:hypothetical protein